MGKHGGQPDPMSGFRAWKGLRAGDGLYRQVTGALVSGGDLRCPRRAGFMDRVIWYSRPAGMALPRVRVICWAPEEVDFLPVLKHGPRSLTWMRM